MKILFNTYPVAFDCPGGGEIQLLKTKEALESNQLKTHVLLFDLWKPQFSEIDIVHYFSVQGGSENFCGHSKRIGKKLVISPILWPSNLSLYPIHEIKCLLNLADIIFPNSHSEAELLAKSFEIPIEKFHVTYNGIDSLFINDDTSCGELFRNHFKVSGPFLLSVGNIEPRKNQLNLAKALKKTDYQLVLLGNIRRPSYLDEVLKAGNGKIKYLGHLPHHDPLLRSAYRGCETFVLPSTLETPGLAALEAAAMGAKIVLTQEGSTREYFEDKVLYVDPMDCDSILRGIELSLNQKVSNPKLKEHISKNFTWANTADQCLDGYKKLLNA